MPQIYTYSSPFSNRYGTKEMRGIWSEANKRILWREAWLELLEVQYGFTLDESTQDRVLSYTDFDLNAASQIEQETRHDLVSERDLFASKLPIELGCHVHTSVTSSDIEDYATDKQSLSSMCLLQKQWLLVLNDLWGMAKSNISRVVLGETHLQYAEPTLLGYRFSWYLSALLGSGISDCMRGHVLRKGMHGAVGSNANLHIFDVVIRRDPLFQWSEPVFQTSVRHGDLWMANGLAQAAAVLHKLAFDLRVLHSQGWVTLAKVGGQVGSSAMPGKNNPIVAEKICGLCRLMPGYARAAWDWSANTLLERTLDDSSMRRVVLPEMFLCMSEIFRSTHQMLSELFIATPARSIVDNWRVWLPSRVLAMCMKRNPAQLLPKDIYTIVERVADVEMQSPDRFLTQVGSEIGIDWQDDHIIFPEGWLWLDDQLQYTTAYLDSTRKFLDGLDMED